MIYIIMRVYNDVFHVYNALHGCYDIADRIVVIDGLVRDYKKFDIALSDFSTDGSHEEIGRFISERDIHNKINYIKKSYNDLDGFFNIFWKEESPKIGDIVLIIDSDEVYDYKNSLRFRDFLLNTKEKSFSVFAYNFVSVNLFRTDSYNGHMGIGGVIETIGQNYTDRYLSGSKPYIIPIIHCFHYSLFKPRSSLLFKQKTAPEVKSHWVMDKVCSRPVFVNDVKLQRYTGSLPQGYTEELGVCVNNVCFSFGGDI